MVGKTVWGVLAPEVVHVVRVGIELLWDSSQFWTMAIHTGEGEGGFLGL